MHDALKPDGRAIVVDCALTNETTSEWVNALSKKAGKKQVYMIPMLEAVMAEFRGAGFLENRIYPGYKLHLDAKGLSGCMWGSGISDACITSVDAALRKEKPHGTRGNPHLAELNIRYDGNNVMVNLPVFVACLEKG